MSDTDYFHDIKRKKARRAESSHNDSETEVEATTSTSSKKTSKKAKPKARRAPSPSLFADSEDEVDLSAKKTKARATKRKQTKKTKRSVTPKNNVLEWFGDDDGDSEGDYDESQKNPAPPPSVITRRVAGGVLRRTAQRDGDLFVELRVYNTCDVKNVNPRDRWEKASINIKYCCDDDVEEVAYLKKFVSTVKKSFKSEGTFFADKKK